MGKNAPESIISELKALESEEKRILDHLFAHSMSLDYAIFIEDAEKTKQFSDQISDLVDRWAILLEKRKELLGI